MGQMSCTSLLVSFIFLTPCFAKLFVSDIAALVEVDEDVLGQNVRPWSLGQEIPMASGREVKSA